ncbi:GTPase domain-containing protein [Metabacillus iocasae]|uniref:GTPase SAR1 family protein n=1 Tax=Priestia iocasae TaxID=2291674 RepID=A0ABS2QZV2_9BACI|nr:dynamin family protein [Metabacillus iocasae]MBM7704266.1 GTPase SAR1 family protein [Metabacillus iocasae]
MIEKQPLIRKSYYEEFVGDTDARHPIRVLGDVYAQEREKEMYDLSPIRFAQGEVYFHHRDYEAAIFKWENIEGELYEWARKNIADAYYEMGILSVAEEIYTSIDAECETLTSEVALQLFSLYLEEHQFDFAHKVIKEAVSFNPDYPNVTELARTFYEEQQDWEHALDLAVNESIRTQSREWFVVLNRYVDEGYTQHAAPDYFEQVLLAIYEASQEDFERLVVSLWNKYRNHELYMEWIGTVNAVFLNLNLDQGDSWKEVPYLFEETYCGLIEGKYFIKELHDLVPHLLTNWLRTTKKSESLFASAAVLAWTELYPSSIADPVVSDAGSYIFYSQNNIDGLDYCLDLFESIINWTKRNGLEVDYKSMWWVDKLMDVKTSHILVAGSTGTGKSSFINSILDEDRLGDVVCPVVVSDADALDIRKVSKLEAKSLVDLAELEDTGAMSRQIDRNEPFVELNLPCDFLAKTNCSFIDTPGFNGKGEVSNYLPIGDGLLFVLDANEPFTDKERDILLEMKERYKDMPLHFILNKMDVYRHEVEAVRMLEDTQERVNEYFPSAKVFPYSSIYSLKEQLQELTEFVQSGFNTSTPHSKQECAMKILFFIRKTLTALLEKRVEMENYLVDSIKWNDEMLIRLNGFINSFTDLEKEKVASIVQSYRKVKESLKVELTKDIPDLLRECSSLITEDSDYSQLHVVLNDKMNEKIHEYLQEQVLPVFSNQMTEWIHYSNEELEQGQTYLEEMAETFNDLYEETRMRLHCDFKVLDDWRRDVNRMTTRIQMDQENIMLRFKPTQFILKSAGKLFGAIPQNKSLLHNNYKKYIENETYEDVTASIIHKFFLQFDLFEKSLEIDIDVFFKEPFSKLRELVVETENEIAQNQQQLDEMRSNPEAYYDPLTLFELRARQYELMAKAHEDTHTARM